jgi:hypothetical protein
MRTLLALGLLLTLAACDAGTNAPASTAQITVRLTDAPFPFDLAESADVTITRIELLPATDEGDDEAEAPEAGRVVLFDSTGVGAFAFNLLDLRDGVTATLVDAAEIPADRPYGQIRIYVGEDASVSFFDGQVFPLKLPSAQQSGIKVNLPDYGATETGEIDLLIDFDVEKSFVVRGNPASDNFQGFLFKPVLELETFEAE